MSGRRARRRARGRMEPYQDEYEAPRQGNGIRQLAALITVAFMATLGVVIGTRLSSDAIAVLVGVIAGVAASIPCALLLMAVTRRREGRSDEAYDRGELDERWDDERGRYGERYDPRRAIPPVIVVTPGQAAPQQFSPWAMGQAHLNRWEEGPPALSQRTFRVMGYEEGEEE